MSDVLPAIAAVLRDPEGRYLIIRRGPGVPAPGYWTPVTGKVEPGESLEAAVERELREEVGLAARAGALVHRSPTLDGKFLIHWLEATPLEAAACGRPLALAADEVVEARWLTALEASRLAPMFPATRAFFLARLET